MQLRSILSLLAGALMLAAIVIATGIYTFRRERVRGQKLAQPVKAPLRLR